ncbi:MAG: sigma-70 family RNA polymerase sigma factor [Planctomycetota bacterium]|jgi:RNA polymerase sigma factor (TIGR02999 family)
MTDFTRILNAIEQGDVSAADKLLPLVYEELRLLASQKLSHETPGQTLQATALVHEAYIRLVERDDQTWDNRRHFFTAAAEAMRRILIENARRKKSLKRGGTHQKVDVQGVNIPIKVPSNNLIVLNEALDKLEEEDRKIAELVKLRYFVGLTVEQAADTLKINRRTAYRYWAYARARLHQELTDE